MGRREHAPFPDIAANVAKYDPENAEHIRLQHAADAALIVALQKIEDIPFVPPIDTSSADIVAEEPTRSRYWTVFGGDRPQEKPRGLERLLR